MRHTAQWKWFFEAPLSPAWRRRLELCFGVVASGAAVVAMASAIPPDPTKLALARAAAGGPSALAPRPPEPPPAPVAPPTATPEFIKATQAGDSRAMARAYVRGMPLEGMLSLAAASGKKAAVAWLLDHGADPHFAEDSPYGPVLAGDASPDIVALLLARGAAEPPLEAAAMANAPNAFRRLMAAHPNVNARGKNPLRAAANGTGSEANKRAMITALLDAGADPNRDGGGRTVLAGAVAGCDDASSTDPADCMRVIHQLVEHGAHVTGDALAVALSLDDATREAPLGMLLAMPLAPGVTATALAEATAAPQADVKRVVAKGIDWSWRDGEDDAALPLLSAIRRNDRDYVRVLLDAGAPVDKHFKDGSSPLGLAIEQAGNLDGIPARIVELLVERGADVNRRLPDGRTPLFAAAEVGSLRIVNFLLSRGARANDRVLDDMALDIAEQNGHLPVARSLHAHGARRGRPQNQNP